MVVVVVVAVVFVVDDHDFSTLTKKKSHGRAGDSIFNNLLTISQNGTKHTFLVASKR